MEAAFRSDKGRIRANNEDSVIIDAPAGIFLLADGMGGHRGGEVASDIAVRKSFSSLKAKLSRPDNHSDFRKYLLESFMEAHRAVKDAARENRSLAGMGTTLLVMVVANGLVYIGNVGDSRAYLMRDSLRQLTKDQTVGAFLIEHKLMDYDEIDPGHWHVLTQAVGTAEDLAPEFFETGVLKGNILILCSDGLTDMLSDSAISAVCAQYPEDVELLAESLLAAANDNGGHDNISVVIVKI